MEVSAQSEPAAVASGKLILVDTARDEIKNDGDCSLPKALRAGSSDKAVGDSSTDSYANCGVISAATSAGCGLLVSGIGCSADGGFYQADDPSTVLIKALELWKWRAFFPFLLLKPALKIPLAAALVPLHRYIRFSRLDRSM